MPTRCSARCGWNCLTNNMRLCQTFNILISTKHVGVHTAGKRQPLALPLAHRRMEVVLKHFSFAKHRYDASAEPKAKVALMMLPIATLLASIA